MQGWPAAEGSPPQQKSWDLSKHGMKEGLPSSSHHLGAAAAAAHEGDPLGDLGDGALLPDLHLVPLLGLLPLGGLLHELRAGGRKDGGRRGRGGGPAG